MMKAGTVTLIGEIPEAHGVGMDPEGTRRKVFCTFRSIGTKETYEAIATGLRPEMKVVLQHDFEYKGERICLVNGKRYEIIRTYKTEADGIELTIQPVTGNARGTGVAGNAQSV